jgi:hypothetical protein
VLHKIRIDQNQFNRFTRLYGKGLQVVLHFIQSFRRRAAG